MRRFRNIALTLFFVGLVGTALFVVASPARPDPRQSDWDSLREGPRDTLQVGWVGHSLIHHHDPHVRAAENLPEMMNGLARSGGVSYSSAEHLLFGAPLSMLWRGQPLSHTRDEPGLVEQRRAFINTSAHLDVLVLTEVIPLGLMLDRENSPFFLQLFQCAFLEKNPDGRVYLFESWTHLQATDRESDYERPDVWAWPARLQQDRAYWEELADVASTGQVVSDTIAGRTRQAFGISADTSCAPEKPIFLIPVATAMFALSQEIPSNLRFNGAPFQLTDLFTNPQLGWPNEWPLLTEAELSDEQVEARLETLDRAYPEEEIDDVHPSNLGIYFAGLVSYATLYRRSPVGLAPVAGLDENSARLLQELVWNVVSADPRTGVAE